jgi:Calcineurin-like phosphoesterase
VNSTRYVALLAAFVILLSTGQRASAAETLVIAGDQHACEGRGDDRTAAGVGSGTVVVLGDMATQRGVASEYECYDSSWGRFMHRTMAVAGNHDWKSGGEAFLAYFGEALGPAWHPTYYGFDRGQWRLYVLDTNCGFVDCDAQADWLRRQLKSHTNRCVGAFFHHPAHTSMFGGGAEQSRPFVRILSRARADLAASAHRHGYERFANMGPDETVRANGLRQFVVGTGGSTSWREFGTPRHGSQVRIGETLGVLRLTLRWDSYDWRFISAQGSVLDRGMDRCSRVP